MEMPTIAELKARLKSMGVKGYAKKNKTELMAMLEGSPVPARDRTPVAMSPRGASHLATALNRVLGRGTGGAPPLSDAVSKLREVEAATKGRNEARAAAAKAGKGLSGGSKWKPTVDELYSKGTQSAKWNEVRDKVFEDVKEWASRGFPSKTPNSKDVRRSFDRAYDEFMALIYSLIKSGKTGVVYEDASRGLEKGIVDNIELPNEYELKSSFKPDPSNPPYGRVVTFLKKPVESPLIWEGKKQENKDIEDLLKETKMGDIYSEREFHNRVGDRLNLIRLLPAYKHVMYKV